MKMTFMQMNEPPEVDLAERLVHLPPGHLREPVVDAGEQREDRPRRDDVVEVADDVVGVVQVDVGGARPSGSPVSPPMPNIGRNASAKSIGVLKRIDPPQSDMQQRRQDDDRRDRDDHRRRLEERAIAVPMPVRNMWCAHTMNDMKPRKIDRVDHRAVAPERLARVVRDDLGDDAHRRQDQHVDLGMREEPEQVLPEQRVAAAGHWSSDLAADDEAARQEEARAGHAIHQLQDRRGLERRERQQQQERRDELRPDEERQPHEASAPGARSWIDRDDEVDRAEQRRGDQEDHADQPHRLARAAR